MVVDAFGLLGCETIPYAVPSLVQRVLTDLQLTRKTIFLSDKGIEKIIVQPQGAILVGPLTTSVNATNGSQALTSTAGIPTWADGCTCNLGSGAPSSSLQSQLAKTSGGWQLVYPFSGATGAVSLTIYNDCVTLNAQSVSVERPVELEGLWELLPFLNPADLRNSSWGFGSGSGDFTTDYGRLGMGIMPGGYPTLSTARNAATPQNYFAYFLPDYTGIQKLRLRVDPLPDQIYVLKWYERRLPADITSLTDTTSLLVPYGMDEAIFLPIMRGALSSHPNFVANRQQAQADKATAMEALRNISNVEPQCDIEVNMSCGF